MDELRDQIETWHRFLSARGAEVFSPRGNLMVGFAYGYACAMVEAGMQEPAREKLRWMIRESEKFIHHSEYPVTAAVAVPGR